MACKPFPLRPLLLFSPPPPVLSLLRKPTSPYSTGGTEQVGTEVKPETGQVRGGSASARGASRKQDGPREDIFRRQSVKPPLGSGYMKAL